MPLTVSPSLAFQAALGIGAVRLRHTAHPSRSPLRPHHASSPRRPRVQDTRLTCAASSPSTILRDDVIAVPSTLSADRHHPVKVSLRAESLGGRRRRVVGGVDIDASVDRVWNVLTTYESMERYMPNIVSSAVESRGGVLYLDQVGIISSKLGLRSRMLVRIGEDEADRIIVFSRVEGRDFSEFEGSYFVREREDGGVRLNYEMVAMPFPLFPMYLVERKIFKEIPKMLASIREEAIVGRHIAFKEE